MLDVASHNVVAVEGLAKGHRYFGNVFLEPVLSSHNQSESF